MDLKEDRTIQDSRQFEALFNFATIGIIISNQRGQIVNFNKQAEQLFGFEKTEVLGKAIEILIPAASRSAHVKYRELFNEQPHPRKMGEGRDLNGLRKDGSTFPVEVSLSYYRIEGETFVLAFVVDITYRKKGEVIVLQQKEELQRVTSEIKKLNVELEHKVEARTKMLRETLVELERSKQELSEAFEAEKELSELKSRFVTMASHEFRTPLSTILSSAYILQQYTKEEDQPKRDKHIERIRNAVYGLRDILEDFLSLGKLEEGTVEARMESISAGELDELLHSVINSMQPGFKPGQHVSWEQSVKTDVSVDKNLLKNIIMNLVSNASKFSGQGATIKISTNVINGELILSVRDQGIGISEEDQQHLFERFFRAKNASNIQGTGLGLNIVSKYLELMKGRVKMNSELEKGSCVTVFIPQSKI